MTLQKAFLLYKDTVLLKRKVHLIGIYYSIAYLKMMVELPFGKWRDDIKADDWQVVGISTI